MILIQQTKIDWSEFKIYLI